MAIMRLIVASRRATVSCSLYFSSFVIGDFVMVASRNRGIKKTKLRDYSHLVLTAEERKAVSAAAHSMDQHPIVTAILGYVLVEHELDVLLRKKFRKTDDATWTE